MANVCCLCCYPSLYASFIAVGGFHIEIDFFAQLLLAFCLITVTVRFLCASTSTSWLVCFPAYAITFYICFTVLFLFSIILLHVFLHFLFRFRFNNAFFLSVANNARTEKMPVRTSFCFVMFFVLLLF